MKPTHSLSVVIAVLLAGLLYQAAPDKSILSALTCLIITGTFTFNAHNMVGLLGLRKKIRKAETDLNRNWLERLWRK